MEGMKTKGGREQRKGKRGLWKGTRKEKREEAGR